MYQIATTVISLVYSYFESQVTSCHPHLLFHFQCTVDFRLCMPTTVVEIGRKSSWAIGIFGILGQKKEAVWDGRTICIRWMFLFKLIKSDSILIFKWSCSDFIDNKPLR